MRVRDAIVRGKPAHPAGASCYDDQPLAMVLEYMEQHRLPRMTVLDREGRIVGELVLERFGSGSRGSIPAADRSSGNVARGPPPA